MILKVWKTMHYVDYFLVEVSAGASEKIDEGVLYDFIKEEEPEPYFTSEGPTSGDVEWTGIGETEASALEQHSGVKRHILAMEPEEKGTNE